MPLPGKDALSSIPAESRCFLALANYASVSCSVGAQIESVSGADRILSTHVAQMGVGQVKPPGDRRF